MQRLIEIICGSNYRFKADAHDFCVRQLLHDAQVDERHGLTQKLNEYYDSHHSGLLV